MTIDPPAMYERNRAAVAQALQDRLAAIAQGGADGADGADDAGFVVRAPPYCGDVPREIVAL